MLELEMFGCEDLMLLLLILHFCRMNINTADFICSNTKMEQLPEAKLPEFAFIGRSNVGKSSLINMLTKRKGLAKTSNTPGKTQTINHFIINNNWYLVDLPGYGFAKVAQTMRATWEKMISHYLQERINLMCVFILIDVRITPQKSDLTFINHLGQLNIPFSIVFTKADKLPKAKVPFQVEAYNKVLLETWEELPQQFVTSAEKGNGRLELLTYIDSISKQYKLV